MIEGTSALFPHKSGPLVWLNHCGVSPLTRPAFDATVSMLQEELCEVKPPALAKGVSKLQESAAQLMKTKPENISAGENCTLFLNNLALALPLRAGDEVIVYQYDYPSPVQAWAKREEQGIVLRKIQGSLWRGMPWKWELAELESLVGPKTRAVCLSHVSFTSGFAADLAAIGRICRERGLFFICDAAQSLGCMPVYPEEVGIDALVSSGWKWLMGHKGTGILYTSPEFRSRVGLGLVGPDMMKQGTNYLDHSLNPLTDANRFKPSTLPYAAEYGLGMTIAEITNRLGIEQVWKSTCRARGHFVELLKGARLSFVPLEEHEQSGMLSAAISGNPDSAVAELAKQGVICSARGFADEHKFLRLSPFFHHSESELERAAQSIRQL